MHPTEIVGLGGWNIPHRRCQNIGTGAITRGLATGIHSQRFLHIHPEHQRLRIERIRGVVRDHQNAWTGRDSRHDLNVIFNGLCDGECFDPRRATSSQRHHRQQRLCEYAIDYYPSGLYDCDGNCYLDFDGDLICNELEVPGCQEPWACNYNPQATDPPLPGFPYYPKATTSIARQQHVAPVSDPAARSDGVLREHPEPPAVATQAAPAAVTTLFPNSCYDDSEIQVDYTTNTFPGDCPGNYTIQRNWLITDCMGF